MSLLKRLWQRRHKTLPARQQLGRRSEQLAARFLRANGYSIEAANVRYPVGEIDLVAREGHTLCFVEVRSARSLQWGGPMASVGDRKRRCLIRAARWYLHRRPPTGEVRFDVIAVTWGPSDVPSFELVRGAFTADGMERKANFGF